MSVGSVSEQQFMPLSCKRVWIGDPCYVIHDGLWDLVVNQVFEDHKEKNFKIKFNFEKLWETGNLEMVQKVRKIDDDFLTFLMAGTRWGDDVYSGNAGAEYPVDSGSLGVVPEYLISKQSGTKFGKFFELPNSFSGLNSISMITDENRNFKFLIGSEVVEEIRTE